MEQKFILDLKQILVSNALAKLVTEFQEKNRAGFWQRAFGSKTSIKSLYIYGDVGRGKSMLMKRFFGNLRADKIYLHFNSFMQLIHEALRDIRKEKIKFQDELIEAVNRVIKENKILCLDEFQVVDIADAMLLSRIFSYLFVNNIIVVFTSNSHPTNLYQNGLQRELFIEFVNNILLKNCEIINLDSDTDYRLKYRDNLAKRYFVSNKKNREAVKEIIINLTDRERLKPTFLKVWGREIKINKTFRKENFCRESKKLFFFPKIAVINFDEVCHTELSASDYREICENFDLIFLLKIPKLTTEDSNETKRLILLIDEIYENKVALIVLAKTKIEKLYENGTMHETFKRTESRLKEIKSDFYWNNSKLNNHDRI